MGSSPSRECIAPPTSDRTYTEQEIFETFGDAYDLEQHNTTETGELFDVENPYRTIRYWYLTDPQGRRLLLPPPQKLHQAVRTNTVLHGWVQPREPNGTAPPVFCSMSNLAGLAFDRTRLFRGMWVMRTDPGDGEQLPIYWLQEPDPTRYTEEDMLPFRAAIAVASNLLDVIERDPRVADRTVSQVLERHPGAVDAALLERHRQFCAAHLLRSTHQLTRECALLRSLRAMRGAGGAGLSPAEERIRTLEAEMRSQQHPWGQSMVPLGPPSVSKKKHHTEATYTDEEDTLSDEPAVPLRIQEPDQCKEDFIDQLQYNETIPLSPSNTMDSISASVSESTDNNEQSIAAKGATQKEIAKTKKGQMNRTKRRDVEHPSATATQKITICKASNERRERTDKTLCQRNESSSMELSRKNDDDIYNNSTKPLQQATFAPLDLDNIFGLNLEPIPAMQVNNGEGGPAGRRQDNATKPVGSKKRKAVQFLIGAAQAAPGRRDRSADQRHDPSPTSLRIAKQNDDEKSVSDVSLHSEQGADDSDYSGESISKHQLTRKPHETIAKMKKSSEKIHLTSRKSEPRINKNRQLNDVFEMTAKCNSDTLKPKIKRPKTLQVKTDAVAPRVMPTDLYKALISLRRYFVETTAPEALKWEQLQTLPIRITDKASAKAILKLAEKWKVVEQSEHCLLLVEAFRQRFRYEQERAGEELSSKLFKDFIFNGWVDQALQWISDSVDARKPLPMNALHLLCSLLTFVGEHKPIQNKENLEQLKQKRNVDLPGFVRKLSAPVYVHSHHSRLAEAYEQAEKRVRDALKQSSALPTESESGVRP